MTVEATQTEQFLERYSQQSLWRRLADAVWLWWTLATGWLFRPTEHLIATTAWNSQSIEDYLAHNTTEDTEPQ